MLSFNANINKQVKWTFLCPSLLNFVFSKEGEVMRYLFIFLFYLSFPLFFSLCSVSFPMSAILNRQSYDTAIWLLRVEEYRVCEISIDC